MTSSSPKVATFEFGSEFSNNRRARGLACAAMRNRISSLLLTALCGACSGSNVNAPNDSALKNAGTGGGPQVSAQAGPSRPTGGTEKSPEQAKAFVTKVNLELKELWAQAARTDWVKE